MAMTLTEIQTWLKERSVELDLSEISSALKRIGKEPKDLHTQTMPMYLADFEEFATSPKTTAMTKSSTASEVNQGSTALTTAPQQKTIAHRPDPSNLSSISDVQAIYADIEIQIESAESEQKDALIEYACSLIDREEQLKELVLGAINARREGTLREFQMSSVRSRKQMTSTLNALNDRDDAFFRSTAEEFRQRIGGMGNAGAS